MAEDNKPGVLNSSQIQQEIFHHVLSIAATQIAHTEALATLLATSKNSSKEEEHKKLLDLITHKQQIITNLSFGLPIDYKSDNNE